MCDTPEAMGQRLQRLIDDVVENSTESSSLPVLSPARRADCLRDIHALEKAGSAEVIPVLVTCTKVFSEDAELVAAARRAMRHLSPSQNPRDPYGVFRI